MTGTLYGASPRYRRARRTAAQMTEFNRAVWDICAANAPLSGRQCYYRAVVGGLVEKDQAGSRANEKMVGAALDSMREAGVTHNTYSSDYWSDTVIDVMADMLRDDPGASNESVISRTFRTVGILPFGWITDNTRTRYQADLHGSKDDALADMARFYRRDLWRSQERHVEVWCESDSIGGVIGAVCDEFGVPLLPCRGQSSKRFIWDSAQSYRELGRPVTCLYVGDFDPAGLDIGNSVKERLARYGAGDVEFRRLAIEPGQVRDLDLPGHGLNPNHPDAVRRRFTGVCDQHGIPREAVEAEAMEPGELRQLVRDAITGYIDQRQWDLEMAIQDGERRELFELAGEDGAQS